MLVPHLLKIYLALVSSNDIMTIKNNTKNVINHKKINKQKRLCKRKKIGLSNGQRGNELRLWDGKKIICKYSLL